MPTPTPRAVRAAEEIVNFHSIDVPGQTFNQTRVTVAEIIDAAFPAYDAMVGALEEIIVNESAIKSDRERNPKDVAVEAVWAWSGAAHIARLALSAAKGAT